MIRLYRPPFLLRLIYGRAIFRLNREGKTLFLTFDDGPTPGNTEILIEILAKHGVKALFFCSGINAEAHPQLVKLLKDSGHAIGNHGYAHLNGWREQTAGYLSDVEKAAPLTSATLFRPPYGGMNYSQYRALSRKYKIIMWDLMIWDFDRRMTREKLTGVFKKYVRPGSVIVLHDKPGILTAEILEELIIFSKSAGYRFETPGILSA